MATWVDKYAPHGPLVGRLTQLADAVGYRVPVGGDVLDLGCGSGDLSRHLASAGLRMTGCDISANMPARATASDPTALINLVRLTPNWRTLPFAMAMFDAVVAASVLEYVTSPDEVLRECARVLRPGGIMLCTAPDPTHPMRWLEWLVRMSGRIPAMRTPGSHWPRADRYLTYLRISRQRHATGWWNAAAAQAGLLTADRPSNAAVPSPLRLLTFQRPTN